VVTAITKDYSRFLDESKTKIEKAAGWNIRRRVGAGVDDGGGESGGAGVRVPESVAVSAGGFECGGGRTLGTFSGRGTRETFNAGGRRDACPTFRSSALMSED